MNGQRVEFAHRRRRRFFQEKVQSRVDGLPRDVEARLRRHAQRHRIELHIALEQFLRRLEARDVLVTAARTHHCRELEVPVLGDTGKMLVLGDLAKSDDAEPECHYLS